VLAKEDTIASLREQMAKQIEKAAEHEMKLQAELTSRGKNTLANLHAMVN